MKIGLFDAYCPELQTSVKIAVDIEVEDPYRNSFKKVFNVPTVLRFLLDDAQGVNFFVDVGANIGHFTLSAGLMGIPTVAVEALADNYLLLTKSLNANSISNVVPFHLAASDDYSPVSLHGNGAWAMISNTEKGDTPGIPLDGLLSLLGRNNPDLIKIDVEGHEIPVLAGLAQTLSKARPMLIFEGNNWSARHSGGYQRLLQVVDSYDYDLFVFNLDGTCCPVNPHSLQDVVCVDYFAYPRGVTQHRPRPRIRVPSIDERVSLIEADVDAGEPHRWHISSIIDRFTAELDSHQTHDPAAPTDIDLVKHKGNYISRLAIVKRRLDQYTANR